MSEPKSSSVKKVLPWLLGVCLLGFVGFVAIFVYEALSSTSVFTAATPTAALRPGSAVKLADSRDGPVTVWQVGDNCMVGIAFGQVPSGSDALTLEDACYNVDERSYYYRVELSNGSLGWVQADDAIPADQYKSPTATPTQGPAPTPRAVATKQTTRQWAGVHVGMPADDVLKIHPKSEMVMGTQVMGSDSAGQIYKWTYPGAYLILARREGAGTDSLGLSECYRVIEIQLR